MSVDTYKCSHCGAQFGITGPGEGTDEDYAAEEYYRSEVEYHETHCQRAEWTAGLRALADLIDANPDLPLPDYGADWSPMRWVLANETEAEQVETARRIIRSIGGTWRKDASPNSNYMTFVGRVAGLHLDILTQRQAVCVRKVVGTRRVPKMVPAPDAPMVEVVEVEEIVEWDCQPLLAEATS